MLRRVFAFFFLLTLAAAASARADEAFRIYDERGVRAIFDITNSCMGLAVQDLAKARDRIVIFDSASSSDLTGKACSPNGIQWNADNWSNGVALMRLLIKEKLDSFFFITADYAFGASLEADARDAIAKAGGTVVGAPQATALLIPAYGGALDPSRAENGVTAVSRPRTNPGVAGDGWGPAARHLRRRLFLSKDLQSIL